MARLEVWSCAPASGANQRTATANLTALFTLLLLPPHIGAVPAAPHAPTNSGHIGAVFKSFADRFEITIVSASLIETMS